MRTRSSLLALPVLLTTIAIAAAQTTVVPKVRQGHYPGSDEPHQKLVNARLKKSANVQIDIGKGKSPALVTYRLTGPVMGFRLKDEHQVAVGDLDGLVADLVKDARTERERAEALFRFVVHEMKDWYYPAQGMDLTVEDLGVLVWNFGYGFCYDLGRLMSGLWARSGLRSRIVGWTEHTVAEVFYDNSWHLYDLQHRSFYEKPDGQVASFSELRGDGQLFLQNLNNYGLDAIGYPPHHMVHWYNIAEPNFEDSNDGEHWKVNKDFRIDLRQGEHFEILYTQQPVAYHPDSWSQFYGEQTLRKEPPWVVKGRMVYRPGDVKAKAAWEKATTPNGNPGYVLDIRSPFIFTEGWIKVPELDGFPLIWVKNQYGTHFVGRLVGGNAIFSKYIAGGNEYQIIVEPVGEGDSMEDFGLNSVEVNSSLQLSSIGLPQLRPGRNLVPVEFEQGRPLLSLWYLEQSSDLEIVNFRVKPNNPRPGDGAALIYTIANSGSGRSQPTSFTVHNLTTAFLSQTSEKLGVYTIPPLRRGKKHVVRVYWQANKRMTWYGQNPNVQLFDAWLDFERNTGDADRDNNRRQDYVLLSARDGSLPDLPGYDESPGM